MKHLRLVVLLAVGAFCFWALAFWVRDDAILLVLGTPVTATVTGVSQRPASSFRQGDYDVEYSFSSEDGRDIRSADVLPPLIGENVDAGDQIDVTYYPAAPSVNRLSSQVSGTPVGFLLVGASSLIYGAALALGWVSPRPPNTEMKSDALRRLP